MTVIFYIVTSWRTRSLNVFSNTYRIVPGVQCLTCIFRFFEGLNRFLAKFCSEKRYRLFQSSENSPRYESLKKGVSGKKKMKKKKCKKKFWKKKFKKKIWKFFFWIFFPPQKNSDRGNHIREPCFTMEPHVIDVKH